MIAKNRLNILNKDITIDSELSRACPLYLTPTQFLEFQKFLSIICYDNTKKIMRFVEKSFWKKQDINRRETIDVFFRMLVDELTSNIPSKAIRKWVKKKNPQQVPLSDCAVCTFGDPIACHFPYDYRIFSNSSLPIMSIKPSEFFNEEQRCSY